MHQHERFEIGTCTHLQRFFESEQASEQTQAANGKFERPGSKTCYAPDQIFDTQHISLDLRIDPRKQTVEGTCHTTFRAIVDGAQEIVFDALRMKILGVTGQNGEKISYRYDGEKIKLRLPKRLDENESVTVSVRYRLTKPIAGVYFIGPDKSYPKKPVQIWTHGEAEESRYWFPCFDAPHDKATTEMRATVPQDFFALSNGALLDVQTQRAARTKTYHWKQAIAHSPYLVTLVAGKFSEILDTWNGLPVQYFCEPGREDDTRRAFGKTPQMLEFFSNQIGVPYPYEKYAQIAVTDFVMGGMEHTTATTQTDRVLMDARAYPEFTADWLVSHELAHQWFGDLLTCKEWGHAWLNESFATYFEALFTEHDLGRDEFEYEMHEKAQSYLDEDKNYYRRSIVTHVYKKPDDLFDRHLYEKGSLVLHTLRHMLGDSLFWKSIHQYVSTYAGQAVETSDLINSIQIATGRNFRKFFDQYVFGPGHPDYTVHYWWEPKTRNAHVRVTQKSVGNSAYFALPLELEFILPSGVKKFTETIDGKKHEFQYRLAQEPLDFRFDPQHKILKVAQVHKPHAAWVHQLASDAHVLGRIQAAKETAKVAAPQSVQALITAFKKEKFWGVAKEIALALGSTKLDAARAFLISAATTANPKVRRGVVEALGSFSDGATAAKLKSVFLKDRSYFVRAEALRSLTQSQPDHVMPWLEKGLRTPSWNETIRATAVAALSRLQTPAALNLVRKAARYGESPSVRGSAVAAMGRCAKTSPEIFKELLELASDPQIRVQNAALTALGNLRNPHAIPTLKKIAKDKNLAYRTTALAEDALLKITPES